MSEQYNGDEHNGLQTNYNFILTNIIWGYVLIWYGGLVLLLSETGLNLAGGAQTSSGPRYCGLHMLV